MPLNYLSDVQPLEGTLADDAAIALHLANRTARAIKCSDAKVLLEETGLVIEDPVALTRSGTLIDRYNAMAAGELKTLLGWFIGHTFGRGDQISSDTNPRAVQLAAVLADLPAGLQAVGQQLLALGGGQPNAGTVEADVIAARAAYQQEEADRQAAEAAEAARRAIINRYWSAHNGTVAPVLDGANPAKADVIAAMRAAADAWEAEA